MVRYAMPALIGLAGVSILLALGTWQLQRLWWKEDMLARITAQIGAPAVAFETALARGLEEFEPVEATGVYTGQEAHLLRSIRGVGVVYRVISPFVTDSGHRILVDRGYVPESAKADARPGHRARILANVHTPRESDRFTPPPDWQANVIFARDVPVLSRRFNTLPVMLVVRELVVRETMSDVSFTTPWPIDTTHIPNNHLGYLITWFSLAAIWLGMTALWMVRIRQDLRQEPAD